MPRMTAVGRRRRQLGVENASAALSRARLAAPYFYELRDSELLDGTLAATQKMELFVSTAGKSPFRTNLPQLPLPRPWVFHCLGVALDIFEDVAAAGTTADNLLTAIISTMEGTFVEFKVSSKNYLETEFCRLSSGCGAYGILAADILGAATSVDAAITNGPPAPNFRAMFNLKRAAVINHGETFKIRITWDHVVDVGGYPNSASLIFAKLIGILDRGVST